VSAVAEAVADADRDLLLPSLGMRDVAVVDLAPRAVEDVHGAEDGLDRLGDEQERMGGRRRREHDRRDRDGQEGCPPAAARHQDSASSAFFSAFCVFSAFGAASPSCDERRLANAKAASASTAIPPPTPPRMAPIGVPPPEAATSSGAQ